MLGCIRRILIAAHVVTYGREPGRDQGSVPGCRSRAHLNGPQLPSQDATNSLRHGIAGNAEADFCCHCRLFVLLSGVPDLAYKAVEFSSLNSALERSEALWAFSKGEASLLVASDAMTRGMDVPSVAAVVNYDAPVYPKTYVHRAGRTARAGRAGGPCFSHLLQYAKLTHPAAWSKIRADRALSVAALSIVPCIISSSLHLSD